MRKSDKKIENNLREALTAVCEVALNQIDGFRWLTHRVDYDIFPASLKIICVFETNANLENAKTVKSDGLLKILIKEKLQEVGIAVNAIDRQVSFDTEEACEIEHTGRWKERLHKRS